MRNDSTVFVGLDVHQKSIVAAYAVDAGEVHDLGQVGVLQRDLDRLCKQMRSKGSRVHFVYEAGPCGYAVYRHLTAKGFQCTVCAPSFIARKPGDRVKTDQRDARKLVQALRMHDLSAVHVARHFAAWFGLTPKEHSSGNTRKLGRISKRGDAYVRMLLTHGARSVISAAAKKAKTGAPLDRLRQWALDLEKRSNRNKAVCALANKMARKLTRAMPRKLNEASFSCV